MRATTERFFSLQDVGDELGVSDQTVRRWVKAGELPAYKPGKEYRIKSGDLDEFLKTREVAPKAPAPLSPPPAEERRTLEGRRLLSTLHPFVTVLERDASRWSKAAESGGVSFAMIEEAVAHREDMSHVLCALVDAALREEWDFDELALLDHAVLKGAWKPWERAADSLIESLAKEANTSDLARLRRDNKNVQKTLSAAEEALEQRLTA